MLIQLSKMHGAGRVNCHKEKRECDCSIAVLGRECNDLRVICKAGFKIE